MSVDSKQARSARLAIEHVQPLSTPSPSVWNLDQRVSLYVYKHFGANIPRPYLLLLEHSGNGLFWIPAAVAAWLSPVTAAQRAFVANLLLGFLIDLVLIGTLKAVFRRKRPVYNKAGDFLLVASIDAHSFPSGHASRACFIAVFCAACLAHYSAALCAAFVAWGIIVSISRALMGRHYVGDVCAGCGLGVIVAAVVMQGTFRPEYCWVSQNQSEQAYHGIFHAQQTHALQP